MGPEKHDFVDGWVPHEVLWGSVRGDRIVWCPGGLWARPFPPKPNQKIILQGFPDFGKSSGGPLALHGASLLPLCGPMGLFCPVWGPAAVMWACLGAGFGILAGCLAFEADIQKHTSNAAKLTQEIAELDEDVSIWNGHSGKTALQ